MTRSAHTFFLALAVAALPAAAQAKSSHGGDGVHIEGAGQENRHLDCNGGSAHIQGASNELTITGACSSLTIEGAANIIRMAWGSSFRRVRSRPICRGLPISWR